MKRKTFAFLGITALLLALLVGYGKNRRLEEAKTLAADYLLELKARVADETIRLTDADAECFGETFVFFAYSEKYKDDFRINVSSDNNITDSYFAISIRDSTAGEFSALLDQVFSDTRPSFELSLLKNIVSSALSGRTFGSIHEAHEAEDNVVGLVRINLSFSDSKTPEEELSRILTSMMKNGFYGDLSIDGDVRVFHICKDEINYTRSDDPPGKVAVYDYPSLKEK